MTGRISIPALRAHAEDQHRPNPAMVSTATPYLLALVEAVEAAQERVHVALDVLNGIDYEENSRVDRAVVQLESLIDALARFDFGEET